MRTIRLTTNQTSTLIDLATSVYGYASDGNGERTYASLENKGLVELVADCPAKRYTITKEGIQWLHEHKPALKS